MFQSNFVDEIKTHILCSIIFSFQNRTAFEVNGEYCTASQATDNNVIRRMRIASWITKATDTLSIFNTSDTAYPQQQLLRERFSVLRLYVHCLSCDVCSRHYDKLRLGNLQSHALPYQPVRRQLNSVA